MKKQLFLSTLLLVGSAYAQQARRPANDNRMKVKSSGVPQFELYQTKKVNGKDQTFRVKNIPKLNLNNEPTLSAGKLTPIQTPEDKQLKLPQTDRLPSPTMVSIENVLAWQVKPAADAKVLSSADTQAPIYQEPLPIQDPMMMKPETNQVKIEDMNPAELKLLQGLIFLEVKKNYPMALGLFAELMNEAPEYRSQAQYSLALTAKGLGLFAEYKFQMLKSLEDKNLDWQKKAALSLAENAQEGDLSLVTVLDPKIEKFKIELNKADQYQMNRAKHYLAQNQLDKAIPAVETIMMDSPLYIDAQFLRGVLLYKSGDLTEAILTMSNVLPELEKKTPVPELKTIAALTLARMYFQQGDYKTSFQTFLKVDKSHPEWPQAMMEQAWAQILAGDNEGAAGNMFSLHTDFFRNTFAPESYVIRTVSYLNLCQYGDGARVLNDLKKRYTPVQKQLASYQQKHTNELDYYETVKTFLKDGKSKEIDGLPRTFIWALARHPGFALEQKNVNWLEEQISRYNKVTMDLINQEKKLLVDQNQLRSKIVSARKGLKPGQTSEEVQELEKQLLSYKIQHHVVKKARTSLKDLRAQGLARIDQEKLVRKKAASKVLQNRFTAMMGTLGNSLDQSDVLQYELYAGAGEHLRFQAAGGEIKPTENEGLKPEANKRLNWEFKGEVWEDELGHYRSSLKNVCADSDNASNEKVTAVDNK